MTKYTRGRAVEYEIIKIFSDAGWDVMRGAGSKGEVFGIKADLVATKVTNKLKKTGIMVIVQAKLETN